MRGNQDECGMWEDRASMGVSCRHSQRKTHPRNSSYGHHARSLHSPSGIRCFLSPSGACSAFTRSSSSPWEAQPGRTRHKADHW